MILTPDDLKALAQCAIEAAVTTGTYISQERPLNVERKDNGGSLASQVVTEVDHESQKRILRILAPTFAQYDLALLTEESADDGSRLEKDHFWCIDPIDGTLYFKFPKPGLGGGCFWDFAAVACIFNELGAPASHSVGLPLNLNRADSVHLSHCGVLFATDRQLSQQFLKLSKKLV